MTQKIYKTAKGVPVDLGALRLKNEHVRAVGNMNVNARGDRIDEHGRVIDSRSSQTQRQITKQTRVQDTQVHDGMLQSGHLPLGVTVDEEEDDGFGPMDKPLPQVAPAPVAPVARVVPEPDPVVPAFIPATASPSTTTTEDVVGGGLAAAMARSKVVKQELEPTPQQTKQSQGVKRI